MISFIRAVEMSIKPPFKFFIGIIGYEMGACKKEWCCNSLSKAKAIGENIFLETGKRTAIYNVHYKDGKWETRAGWLSSRILELDSGGAWFNPYSDFLIHTAFLWHYNVYEWDKERYKKLRCMFLTKQELEWEYVKKELNLVPNEQKKSDDFKKDVKRASKNLERAWDKFILAEDELTMVMQKKYPNIRAKYAVFDRMIMFSDESVEGDEKEFQSLEEVEKYYAKK